MFCCWPHPASPLISLSASPLKKVKVYGAQTDILLLVSKMCQDPTPQKNPLPTSFPMLYLCNNQAQEFIQMFTHAE